MFSETVIWSVPACPCQRTSRAENTGKVRDNMCMPCKTSLFLVALIWLTACTEASEAPVQQAPDNAGRIVAIGDIHADINAMRGVFRLAGAIDEQDQWIGGELTVVQLGDMIGRSDDERQVLDLIFDLQEQAEQAGGRLYALIGNHEIMGARVDNQAVGPNPFAAWQNVEGLDLRDSRLENLLLNERHRGAALMAGGPYAQRLSAWPTVLQLGDTVYVHGGVVPRWADYGIERINEDVSAWLRGDSQFEPDSSQRVDDSDRVMWARHFSARVDSFDCQMLDTSLEILGARRMVVAHSRHPQITSYCNEKVWVIDTGMSRAYGGQIQALELVNDNVSRILDPDGNISLD